MRQFRVLPILATALWAAACADNTVYESLDISLEAFDIFVPTHRDSVRFVALAGIPSGGYAPMRMEREDGEYAMVDDEVSVPTEAGPLVVRELRIDIQRPFLSIDYEGSITTTISGGSATRVVAAAVDEPARFAGRGTRLDVPVMDPVEILLRRPVLDDRAFFLLADDLEPVPLEVEVAERGFVARLRAFPVLESEREYRLIAEPALEDAVGTEFAPPILFRTAAPLDLFPIGDFEEFEPGQELPADGSARVIGWECDRGPIFGERSFRVHQNGLTAVRLRLEGNRALRFWLRADSYADPEHRSRIYYSIDRGPRVELENSWSRTELDIRADPVLVEIPVAAGATELMLQFDTGTCAGCDRESLVLDDFEVD